MDHFRNIDCVPPGPNRTKYNNVLSVSLTPENSTEPVTLEQVKRKLRIMDSTTDYDDELNDLITQCRQAFEEVLGVSLIQRSVYAVLQNELGNIELPYGPVNTVTNAQDKDGNNIDSTSYDVLGQGFQYLETKFDWIGLTYTTDADTREGLIKALLNEICWCFNHRGDEDKDSDGLHAKEAYKYKRGSWLL